MILIFSSKFFNIYQKSIYVLKLLIPYPFNIICHSIYPFNSHCLISKKMSKNVKMSNFEKKRLKNLERNKLLCQRMEQISKEATDAIIVQKILPRKKRASLGLQVPFTGARDINKELLQKLEYSIRTPHCPNRQLERKNK